MKSVKLSITCRAALEEKYDAKALARIDDAIQKWIAADAARGIVTMHFAVDDAKAMNAFDVPPVTGNVTAEKVKRAIDGLVARLTPDYIVLLGSTDVVPMFEVENPTRSPRGDSDVNVPTDNPYASSREFNSKKRSTYLVPDRVVGRIPDLLGSADDSWLTDYLAVATSWKSLPVKRYAMDLLVCADTWKGSGKECVKFLSRAATGLLRCPPVGDKTKKVRDRHKALFQMIKCHGAPIDSAFYGQGDSGYPEALRSVSLDKRTRKATVVGAMCCFGASVFDPDDPAAARQGEPPIPSVYLRQGAFGFFGSTGTAWVGADVMLDADWVVATFLKSVLAGASLGRAALEAKQDFVRWTRQQGDQLDAPDEKTLVQFVLLGDPSIHPVVAASPAGVVTAAMLGAAPIPAVALARRSRRAVRHDLGAMLRDGLPSRAALKPGSVPSGVQAAATQLAEQAGSGFQFNMTAPEVQRVTTTVKNPEMAVRPSGRPVPASVRAITAEAVDLTSYQYYWAARYHKTGAPIGEIRLLTVQADSKGNVLRSHLLVSSIDLGERHSEHDTSAAPDILTPREITAAARTAYGRSPSGAGA